MQSMRSHRYSDTKFMCAGTPAAASCSAEGLTRLPRQSGEYGTA
jgi:hypothetical protein